MRLHCRLSTLSDTTALRFRGPIYKLVTTDLGGERRFAASVARRLLSLGALTKGDRRAATVADLSSFNYDTVYGRTALRLMYKRICSVSVSHISLSMTSLVCLQNFQLHFCSAGYTSLYD